jgi:hypothetical protein
MCANLPRDIGLNLRIVNEATTELGLETHVCEVQLLLRPYAELKVPPPLPIPLSLPHSPRPPENLYLGPSCVTKLTYPPHHGSQAHQLPLISSAF